LQPIDDPIGAVNAPGADYRTQWPAPESASIPAALPLNLYSIGDVAEWRRDFYWPISQQEIYAIELACFQQLVALIRATPTEVRTVLRIAASCLYTQFNDWCAEMIAAHRLADLAGRYQVQYDNRRAPRGVFLPEAHNIYAFYQGGVPRCDYHGWPRHPSARCSGRFFRCLRSLAGRLYMQNRLSRKGLIGPARNLAVNPNPDTLLYLARRRIRFKYLKSDQFFKRLDPQSIRAFVPARSLVAALWELIGIVEGIFLQYTGAQVNERLRQHFHASLMDLLKVIALDLQYLRSRARRLAQKNIYTGTGGNYFTRVLAAVARENGSHVMGFPHGGSAACIHFPKFALTEMELCDAFLCYDSKERDVNRRYETIDNRVRFCVEPGEQPSLLDCPVPETCRKIDLSRVHTVMCVAPGYFFDRHGSQIIPETVHFEFEVHLIEFFLALGKRVIYKHYSKSAHYSPGFNMFDLFQGRNVVFESRGFSSPEVLAQGDVFVFTKAASTALYEAMTLTHKPIVLFHPDIPRLTREFRDLGRVQIVYLQQDSKNRLRFDPEQFCRDFKCRKQAP